MDILYDVVKVNGRWGFWCDAYEEKEMLKLVNNGDRVVGSFIEPGFGPRLVRAIGGDRKRIVANFPKVRTFFALYPALDETDETWKIDWVGHIGCFPISFASSIMSRTHDAYTIIAKGKLPNEELMWASVVEILPEMLIPLTLCCDV